MKTIKNPITNRKIFVNGPTYNQLLEDPRYSAEVKRRSEASASRPATRPASLPTSNKPRRVRSVPNKIKGSKTTALRKSLAKQGLKLGQVKKMKGCGSVGKYKPGEAPFCGPAGGACDLSFPVNTKKRAINAVVRSVNAPNPEGIRKCATDYAVKKGWITKEDRTRLLQKYK